MNIATPASASLAMQRQHRARAAGILLALAREHNLASPDAWGWGELALVPQWCFLETAELRHLQRVAGAVFLSVPLAQCIDGRVLAAVSSSIGNSLLNRLLDGIDMPAQSGAGPEIEASVAENAAPSPAVDESQTARLSHTAAVSQHAPFDFSNSDSDTISTHVDLLLLETGAAVLMATVDQELPVGLFESLLGSVAGSLPAPVGLQVVEQATQLIATSADEPQAEIVPPARQADHHENELDEMSSDVTLAQNSADQSVCESA